MKNFILTKGSSHKSDVKCQLLLHQHGYHLKNVHIMCFVLTPLSTLHIHKSVWYKCN
jgi:hypothetical protein